MSIVTCLFQEISTTLNISENSGIGEIDQVYYSEISEMVEILNPFDLYKELTYMYVRYTKTKDPYKHIPAFIEENQEYKVLVLISYLRAFAARNIIEFYEQVVYESQHIINLTIKNNKVTIGKLLPMIKTFTFKQNPAEILINLEVSLCEFSEYISYLLHFIQNHTFLPEDLEFIIAVSIYFSYFNKDDTVIWQECSSFVIKVFNCYTNDALRKDSFFNMNGISLYELFKMNEMLKRTNLRDINLWVLTGYRYRLDTMQREWEDIKESIDREEFNMKTLVKCQENVEEASNIYSSYQFCNWNVNYGNNKQAKDIIVMYTWAKNKINKLKD